MNLRPWMTGIVLSLLASTTGCGNVGNNAGNTANAVGNAAGFAASGVGNVARTVGNAIGNATGLTDNRAGTWSGNGRNTADVMGNQAVQVDSATRLIHIRLSDGTGNDRGLNNPRTRGGFRNNALSITVPTGWTVRVSAQNNNRWNRTLAIVPYNGGVRTDTTGQPGTPDPFGTNRPGMLTTPNRGVTTGTNLGISFKVSSPGRYSIVATARGQQDEMVDVITVSNTTNLPSISTTNTF